MRYGDELAQVLEWVYTTLTGDQALADALGVPLEAVPDRVWPDVAPGDTDPPWVVYSAQEAQDVPALGNAPRIMSTALLTVKVVQRSSDPSGGAAVARRLHHLIHGGRNVPLDAGGLVLTSTRVSVFDYPETLGGIQYRHTGGVYRVQVN